MKSNWIRTDRLWCMLIVLAVFRITESSSKNIDQVKVPIPTKETLPQVLDKLKAVAFLDEDDGLQKNFEGQQNSNKRLPRNLESDSLNQNSDILQNYQGVVGRPGVDFPILPSIPHTDFSCKKVKKPGYYADPQTDCQVFHICDNGRKVSFLCPNGTVFRQSHLICDWWFRVDCERSIELYEESAEQLASDQRTFKERSEALAKAMLKVQNTSEKDDRVVTERSFGPSTTIFNSESRLPERARYFSSYSRDENQVPAETGSFAGNHFQTNLNNYYQKFKTPEKNWNQDNFQSDNYQIQSSTTAQPTWNQAINLNYQSSSYQPQPPTTSQPDNIQNANDFQSGNQPLHTTSAQSIQNQGIINSHAIYQSQATTVVPQANFNQYSNSYQPVNYQSQSTTESTPTSWNNQNNNNFRTENDQLYTPTATQTNWNQGYSDYQSINHQQPSTTTVTQTNWNNQGANIYQDKNHQESLSTTPQTSINWNNQGANNYGTVNDQKHVTNTFTQTNWDQTVNNFQTNDYQSQAVTTVQPEWSQESDTIQPGSYQSQQSFQQPTTIFSTEKEQTNPPKESQVPAESASFVGHQNSQRFNFQAENYYTQISQTNPPPTTYPVTTQHSNEHLQNGASPVVDYQLLPDTHLAREAPTPAPSSVTTVFDYTIVNNSTFPPSGETLIPNMINSLQTLTDNNLLYDIDGQNPYPSQVHSEDDLNSVALYFNNIKNPQISTVASDMQFNYNEQTSQSNTNGVSSVSIPSVETTTSAIENLDISAVLTQNTQEAYNKLFKNETNKESTTTAIPLDTTISTPSSVSTVNLGFTQGLQLNRSSAELRELAAVFTRALTAYLDDPENFRKILAEVRPTEPPNIKTSVTEEQEVLDFSDDSKSHRNKPTEPSTKNPNLAADINGMTQHVNVDLSTIIPQYTTSPLVEITSKYTGVPNAGLQEYAPPADSEQLQVAGSQSYYSSRDNSIETAKILKPATSTVSWTVSPLIDTDEDVKSTTLPPIYFTTTAENLETTVIVQRAKEMFSHLNASDAGVLMNAMKADQANDTVKRLVLLLVNDPNKEHSPEQTRNHIIEALLDNGGADGVYGSSSPLPSTSPVAIPFGQRLQDDGSPAFDGQRKRPRKGTRRRVAVHRSRSVPTSTEVSMSTSRASWQGANDLGGPGLSSDSDARAVELLKSLYSIASKWS